jgi:hypothetical protein
LQWRVVRWQHTVIHRCLWIGHPLTSFKRAHDDCQWRRRSSNEWPDGCDHVLAVLTTPHSRLEHDGRVRRRILVSSPLSPVILTQLGSMFAGELGAGMLEAGGRWRDCLPRMCRAGCSAIRGGCQTGKGRRRWGDDGDEWNFSGRLCLQSSVEGDSWSNRMKKRLAGVPVCARNNVTSPT